MSALAHGTEDLAVPASASNCTGKRRSDAHALPFYRARHRAADLQGITTRAMRPSGAATTSIPWKQSIWITSNARPLRTCSSVLVKTDPLPRGPAPPRHEHPAESMLNSYRRPVGGRCTSASSATRAPSPDNRVLDDVRVPCDRLVGGVEGRGSQQALSALEVGRITLRAAPSESRKRHTTPLPSMDRTTRLRSPAQPQVALNRSAEFQAIQLKLARHGHQRAGCSPTHLVGGSLELDACPRARPPNEHGQALRLSRHSCSVAAFGLTFVGHGGAGLLHAV